MSELPRLRAPGTVRASIAHRKIPSLHLCWLTGRRTLCASMHTHRQTHADMHSHGQAHTHTDTRVVMSTDTEADTHEDSCIQGLGHLHTLKHIDTQTLGHMEHSQIYRHTLQAQVTCWVTPVGPLNTVTPITEIGRPQAETNGHISPLPPPGGSQGGNQTMTST